MSVASGAPRIRTALHELRAVKPGERAALGPDVVDIELRIAGQLMVDQLERLAQRTCHILLMGGIPGLVLALLQSLEVGQEAA
jgi:hypothetical protein